MKLNIFFIFLALTLKSSLGFGPAYTGVSSEDYFIPNQWSSVAECPVRYYDFGTVPSRLLTSTVAHGLPVIQKEFAHMAVLGWTDKDKKINWKCGASLISENFVLSAAHCGYWNGNQPDVVRVGDINLETANSNEDEFAQQIKIEKVIFHPEYQFLYSYHDLALLKLQEPVKVTRHVCPACLWTQPTLDFKSLEACGFGEFDVQNSLRLLKVQLSPVDQKNCSNYYPPDRKLNKGLGDGHICAVDPKFEQDTCPGASGGPLQIKLQGFYRLIPFIVGVTSFGRYCGTETPGVYTRVSSYVDWIAEVTAQDFDALQCSLRHSEMREYSPEVITDGGGKSRLKLGFYNEIGHREFLEPGNCGCVFIHEMYVVSSASCVDRTSPKRVLSTRKNLKFDISQTFVHPLYREGSANHNIALVKILKPAVFEKSGLTPSCLWTKDLPGVEVKLHVFGPHGLHAFYPPEKVSSDTQNFFFRVQEISDGDCNKFYKNEVSQNQACYARNLERYILPNTCEIDDGGPIERDFYLGGNSKYFNFVMGINSYGQDCGYGYPSVATKVSNYIEWIDSIIFGECRRGLLCKSPLGNGRCLPSSECPTVVNSVRNGATTNDFICNFNDIANPLVCCPRTKTVFDDCPKSYERYRNATISNPHLAIIDDATDCFGALISENLVITANRCVNTSLTVKLGDPKCNSSTMTQVLKIVRISSTTSVLVLKEKVKLSSCLLPICLWTDPDKIPFDLAALSKEKRRVTPYRQEKCEEYISKKVNQTIGCGHLNAFLSQPNMYCFIDCYEKKCPPSLEILQFSRFEGALKIPYLVGIATTDSVCRVYQGNQHDNTKYHERVFYFEKLSSILHEIKDGFD